MSAAALAFQFLVFDYEECRTVLSGGCAFEGATALPITRLGKYGKRVGGAVNTAYDAIRHGIKHGDAIRYTNHSDNLANLTRTNKQISNGTGVVDDFTDHVVLGKSIGLDDQAAKIGGRHLMGSADWQADVLASIADPNTRISLALDGLEGVGSPRSRVMAAVQRASSGRGSPFDWELMQLHQSG